MKKNKRLYLSLLAMTLLVLLSGCVKVDKTGHPTGEGWMYNLLVHPLGQVLSFFANNLGLGFGVAIILLTVIVRLLILPMGVSQAEKAAYQSERMNYLKPILAPIQERMQAGTPEEKMAAQQEYMAVQRQYGVNPLGGIGCLPLILQMIVFTGLFYAARYTKGISSANFLGMNLGKPSLILVVLVAILYLLQGYLSVLAVDESQRKQMRTMMLISPAMITWMSLSSPAGVALYWVVGGVFSVVQQLIINYIVRPRLKKKVAEEFKDKPLKPTTSSRTVKDVTPSAPVIDDPKAKKKNRNAGKQRSRH